MSWSAVSSNEKWRRRAVYIGWSVVGAGVILVGGAVPFLLPALRRHCLPYVPASPTQTHRVMAVLKTIPAGRVVDLGSGDGRVVVAAARSGHYAVGYELNLWLVLWSRMRALYHGVSKQTEFHRHDLWKVSLAQYDAVIIFGVDEMMQPLGKKLIMDTSPGAQVIACRFPFPGWQASSSIGLGMDSVWVYDMDTIKKQPRPR